MDLPGYGYARVSKKPKAVFQQFIMDYFEQREQLICAFVLIDIRLEAQKSIWNSWNIWEKGNSVCDYFYQS